MMYQGKLVIVYWRRITNSGMVISIRILQWVIRSQVPTIVMVR